MNPNNETTGNLKKQAMSYEDRPWPANGDLRPTLSRALNHPLNAGVLEEAHRILRACRSNPTACRRDDLDQCPATIRTTIRRMELLSTMENLSERRFLLLGDDDLLSVALAAAHLSVHLTVLDLDLALLERIKRWASDVHVIHHDLRLGLPPILSCQFDVVFTDPPYTVAGQMLFLRYAIDALCPSTHASLYLCASRAYLSFYQIAQIVEKAKQAGLRLVAIHEDFNEYRSPPDVVMDLKRRTARNCIAFLRSSLLHFKPSTAFLCSRSVPLLPDDIYSYYNEASDATC